MTTKEKLLAIFLKQAEQPLSGEVLGKKLNVSRTAVWKAIQTLKKEGHLIESLPNVGYVYLPSDTILASEILKNIGTHVPQLTIQVEKEVTSTNDLLKKASIDGVDQPVLLIAENQTKGRGRFGRDFISNAEKGIYFSLLLNVQKKFNELPSYTILSAAALAAAIEKKTEKNCQIKWVNDLYYQNKKIAGILSEATTDFETQSITSIVIGVGLNFLMSPAAIPTELQEKVGSLFTEQPEITRNQLIAEFLNQFFDMLQDKEQNFLTEYRQRSFVLGKQVTFKQQGKICRGVAKAIGNTGELIVTLDTGGEVALSSGEISLSSIT
ncbi:biotin--[acetyl-CoA-carboxylase] ligase [Vagococcus elongatus]|uniref:Bifunctional ligase/repressor BirA n=1 Tax=Vagococcus elongatus TaxID=180344 RepID=A0A430AV24_9ENTE|nr:biotin--[acetyl-CoA-carboxylase] ligase [Vagococcus elongatus]RSU11895.1 biotin--[acetyl-CoA-carboxylase] ligase [Vagococcus elongatus]